MAEKKAWVTLVTENSYLKGLQCLARSLERVQTVYPLIVLHPDTSINISTGQPKEKTSLTAEDLESIKNEGCELKAIERIYPTSEPKEYVWDHFQDSWTKLRVWDIEGYDRVVFLDADMLVMKNIDHLMNMNLPKDFLGAVNACTCNPRKRQNYPKDWIPSSCSYTLGPIKPESEDTPPPVELKGYFNSGLLVLTPSKQIFEDLSNYLYNHPDVNSLSFPDQDVLNECFKGKWVPLSYTYNALKTLRTCHPSIWEDKAVRNVHYIMSDKPWKKEIVDFEQEYDDVKKTGDQEAISLFILNSWWWKVYKGIEFRIGDD
ncbi:nucleotide-diphospho-sugar transferase [Rhizophagus irregularis]|uniref:Nucleotide-diphospho-sugar transferase n=1 Tax=Rhizophagus irregularis TaxID=588596 RepID=A0A2I1H346_9GLOM|nr:nucleotide-diphospho-sugar transferase [Rhizophagus irregularis]